jgi:hypothetical protein
VIVTLLLSLLSAFFHQANSACGRLSGVIFNENEVSSLKYACFSQANFAYGSTPYATWRRVMESRFVSPALANALAAHTRAELVAGRSLRPGGDAGRDGATHAERGSCTRLEASDGSAEPVSVGPFAAGPALAAASAPAMGELECASAARMRECAVNAGFRAAAGPGSLPGAMREYLVLGSSLGWLVLFAAATYGLPSR